jgi:hypothetical protein
MIFALLSGSTGGVPDRWFDRAEAGSTQAGSPQRRSWMSMLLIAGILVTAWSSGSVAQINPFRGYKGPTLTKEDLAAGRTAAGKLLTEDQAEVGKSEDWAGPTSGNRGSFSVQKAFRRQGMDCRSLRSEVRYKNGPVQPRTFILDVCKLQSGEWKLL